MHSVDSDIRNLASTSEELTYSLIQTSPDNEDPKFVPDGSSDSLYLMRKPIPVISFWITSAVEEMILLSHLFIRSLLDTSSVFKIVSHLDSIAKEKRDLTRRRRKRKEDDLRKLTHGNSFAVTRDPSK